MRKALRKSFMVNMFRCTCDYYAETFKMCDVVRYVCYLNEIAIDKLKKLRLLYFGQYKQQNKKN